MNTAFFASARYLGMTPLRAARLRYVELSYVHRLPALIFQMRQELTKLYIYLL